MKCTKRGSCVSKTKEGNCANQLSDCEHKQNAKVDAVNRKNEQYCKTRALAEERAKLNRVLDSIIIDV